MRHLSIFTPPAPLMRAIALLAATALGGCVIYDTKPCPTCGSDGLRDTGAEEPIPAPEFWLSPDSAEANSTVIVSLQSDQAVDFEAVVDLDFLGEIAICTTSARDDELLITISIGDIEGPVDLLVEFEGDDNVLIDGAITVFAEGGSPGDGEPGDDEPGDGGGDGDPDDGGDDDGGDDTPDDGGC